MSIDNQVVWILRPAGSGDALARSVRSGGGVPVCLPMIEIHWGGEEESRQRLFSFCDYDCLIFVSRNALEGAKAVLNSWPPEMLRMPVFAPGRITGSALEQEGFVDVTSAMEDGGSEALLQMPVFTRESLAGLSILIIRGQGGREWLRDQLLNKKADRVDYAEVYHRKKLAYNTDEMELFYKEQPPDSVVIHSATALTHLWELTPRVWRQTLQNARLIVLSERLRLHAKSMGFHRIQVATDASEASCLKALATEEN